MKTNIKSLFLLLLLATGCVVQSGRIVYVSPVVPQNGPDNYQVQRIRQKAEQGDAIAEYLLGSYYTIGRGVPRDNTEAARWFHFSAAQGYAPAQYRLAVCYANGRGVPRNRAEAANWCRKAAAQGSLAAQHYLNFLESRPVAGAYPPGNPPNSGAGNATSEPSDATAQNPLTVAEIKTLSSAGVKAETLIGQIKETNSKFSPQDIAAAQQANPPVDPEVIICMKENVR